MLTTCPSCAKKLNVADSARGKKIRCPKCSNVFALPPDDATQPIVPAKSSPAPPKKPRTPVPHDDDTQFDAPAPLPPPRRAAKREDDDETEVPRRRSAAAEEDDGGAGGAGIDQARAQRRASLASLAQRLGAYLALFFYVIVTTLVFAFLGPGSGLESLTSEMTTLIMFFGGVGAVVLFFVVLIVLGASQLKKFGSLLVSWIGAFFSFLAAAGAGVAILGILELNQHVRFHGAYELLPTIFMGVFGVIGLVNFWGAVQAVIALCSGDVNAMFRRQKVSR